MYNPKIKNFPASAPPALPHSQHRTSPSPPHASLITFIDAKTKMNSSNKVTELLRHS